MLAQRGIISDKNIDGEKMKNVGQEKKYHNTLLLLKNYRTIAWVLECFPDTLAEELEQPFEGLDELLDRFDSLFQGDGNNISADNPSKYLLYQDAMLGMFDYHIQGVDTKSYYKDLADKLDKCANENSCYKTLFNFYKYFALVLSEKADLGIRLKRSL